MSDDSWIKPGALCNCAGEGSATLLIHSIDESAQTVSVSHISNDIQKKAPAKKQWQECLACVESFSKLHQDYLSELEKKFNLIDLFGIDVLEKPIQYKNKLIKMPCPDNILETILQYFNINEDTYSNAGYGTYIGAYLAEKILKSNRNVSMSIGVLINEIYQCSTEMVFSGDESDSSEKIQMLIESLYISSREAKHFAETIQIWSEAVYYQELHRATGR